MNLQFRAEIFNLLNRANFNTPNLITNVLLPAPNATVPVQSPAAGAITQHVHDFATSAIRVEIAVVGTCGLARLRL